MPDETTQPNSDQATEGTMTAKIRRDITKGLKALHIKRERYRTLQRYYDGDHNLIFATEKFYNTFGPLFRELADNLCPLVVDSMADRLIVRGFNMAGSAAKLRANRRKRLAEKLNEDAQTDFTKKTVEAEAQAAEQGAQFGKPVLPMAPPVPPLPLQEIAPPPAEKPTLADEAWDIWNDNRMDENAGLVISEAIRLGDAYVLVWPDPEDETRPVIYPQEAKQIHVQYDAEQPGKILWAVKAWRDEDTGQYFVTAYYPDAVYKYHTADKVESLPDKADGLLRRDVVGEAWPLDNPYERVPIFHFRNNAPIGKPGRSELIGVKPIQDALNKSICDMLVAMEFAAMPQRWATGLEVEVDEESGKPKAPFKPGIDRLWTVADERTRFGQFDAGQLSQFLAVQDSFRMEIARISGTPLTYMMLNANPPSGEALKALDARFTKKVIKRQTSYGNVWEDVMVFCLVIAKRVDPKKTMLDCDWEDAQSVSELEQVQLQVTKQAVGYSQTRSLREIGLSDAEIEENEQEKTAEQKSKASIMAESLRGFERGGGIKP